ncbi:MAG: hypothetical protein QXT42_05170 [Thermoplasmata archaeon]
MGSDAINPEIIKRKMWMDYQYASTNPANEYLDCINELLSRLTDPAQELGEFLQHVADSISNKLYVREVTIGIKSPEDGLYRYVAQAGLREQVWEEHKKLAYVYEQFVDTSQYKYKQISKYTKLYLIEDNPYAAGEEGTYDKALRQQSVRKALDDSLEGDYLDISVLGKNDELLGWIEISGLKTGKLPDTHTIKCLEMIASIIGVALTHARRRRAD